MDALEFLKEQSKMCKSYTDCGGCPLERGNCGFSTSTPVEECERIVTAVEQWSKEHARKTRQSVFLEQYPETAIDAWGVLDMCPVPISKSHRNIYGACAHAGVKCIDCRREFWMQEVE